MIDRRGFLIALLAHTIAARNLLAANASPALRDWIAAHEHLAKKLHADPDNGPAWMRVVEELSSRIDLDELLQAIDFAKIERELRFTSDGGTKHPLRLGTTMIGVAIFGLEKGRSITPHGHRNMASAHLVIAGKLRARNFDRLADEPEHLILQPTVDATIGRGAVSTMSTQRNNIHWFTALTDRAFTLDVVVSDLKEGDKSFYIDLVDPNGGTKRGDGTIRAPRIDWKTSVRLYG
jgi:hypothetical protein